MERDESAKQLDGGAETQAAQQPTEADINADEACRALDLCQLEVVDFDDAKPLRVDDLLVQDVALEQELIRVRRICGDALLLDGEMNVRLLQVMYLRPGNNHVAIARTGMHY